MAIKRLRVNDEGEHEERDLEHSELPPPPAKPLPRERSSRKRRSTASESTTRPASRVQVTKSAQRVMPAGRTVLDEGVIRYVCTQCEGSRVMGQVPDKPPECTMCQRPMRLQNR